MNRTFAAILLIATFAVGQCSSDLFGCDACGGEHNTVTAEDLRVFDELIAEQRMMILNAAPDKKSELAKGLRELAMFRQRLENCSACPLVDTDRSFLETIMTRREANLNTDSDVRLYEGLSSLLERVRQCVANRRNRTICGTCHKPTPCSCVKKAPCCEDKTACCKKPSTSTVTSSFDITSQCGTRFHNNETVVNGTKQEVCDAGERSDMRFNSVIGSQSWGCHVRPEPTIIVQPQVPYCYGHGGHGSGYARPYSCFRYGGGYPAYAAPAVYPTAYSLSTSRTDTRNPVINVPPGTPNPGCSCPGHAPGEPCHCGPECRQCRGACSAR